MNGHIGILGEQVNRNGTLPLNSALDNELEILNVIVSDGRVT